MAIPGRKPKPSALKLIEGNPGRRAIRESLKAPQARLQPPPDLCEEAAAEWRRIVPVLRRLGVLSRVDENAIADYCLCVVRLAAAEAEVGKRGLLVVGERGMVKNPAVQLARDYRMALQRWSAEFGLTPSSRSRMTAPEPAEKSLDELLG